MYVEHPNVPVSTKSGTSKRSSSRRATFGRVDSGILADKRLSHVAARVYGALTTLERSGRVTAGTREIARASASTHATVQRSLGVLVELGYLEIKSAPHGKRQSYSLLSSIFSGKREANGPKGDIKATVGEAKSVNPEAKCAKCGTTRKRLGKSGQCRICVRKSNIEREVARILAVDPAANEEQIYLKVKARNAKEVRAAIKKVRVAA